MLDLSLIRVRGQDRSSGGDLTSDLRPDKPNHPRVTTSLSPPVSPQCWQWQLQGLTSDHLHHSVVFMGYLLPSEIFQCPGTADTIQLWSLSLLEPQHGSIPLTPSDPVLDTASWLRYWVSLWVSPESQYNNTTKVVTTVRSSTAHMISSSTVRSQINTLRFFKKTALS